MTADNFLPPWLMFMLVVNIIAFVLAIAAFRSNSRLKKEIAKRKALKNQLIQNIKV